MPSKNALKQYVAGGYYHIYNRGVNKCDIFLDERDYKVFLHFLKIYLSDPQNVEAPDFVERSATSRVTLFGEIELLAYCLMPNHFHLLVKQENKDSISKFMRCVATNYSMYFNKRYDRTGHLFQGRYKASLIDRDEYLVHLSGYVHMNPVKVIDRLEEYPYSSYRFYLKTNFPTWFHRQVILNHFSDSNEYRKFIDSRDVELSFIKDLALEGLSL